MYKFCFAWLCLTLLIGCQQGSTSHNCSKPAGRFINTTVLSRCPEAMPSDVPHFCFEMTFGETDSVMLDNGFEKFKLPYLQEGDGCSFKISAASLFGDMYFTLENDSTLALLDTAWTKVKTHSVFSKSQSGNTGFEEELNTCLISGQYALYKEGQLQPGKVDILENGQLNGLKPYIGYSICYAGDCLEETSPPARTITFTDDRGQQEVYAFTSTGDKATIELFSIGPPIPDIKGERTIGPKVYELKRE